MKVAVIYNKGEEKDTDVINVFGMQTKERYSSRMAEMVASALEKGGHNVRILDGNMQIIDELQNFMPKVVRGERPGMVFNMAYGIQGQSRYTHLPAMLEMLGIPYIGSGPSGHAVALDKVLSKILFLQHKLPTPPFWVFSDGEEDIGEVQYPVIVKPKMEAVSFGLCVVDNAADLKEAIKNISREFGQQVLAEVFIPGREFCVALLGNGATLETLPIVEIDLQGDPNAIQTVYDKTQKPLGKICPADVPPDVNEQLCGLAKKSFNSLGLCDFSRVDFRMDENNSLHILEINSMASLNLSGSYVLAANADGMDFTVLINRMLDIAAIRYFGEKFIERDTGKIPSAQKTQSLHGKIRSYMRSHLSTIVDYVERMVSVNSYVHYNDEVNALGGWIVQRFNQLGFKKRIFSQAEVGKILYFTNHQDSFNDLLILGHFDTVYDAQNYIPFSEVRGRLIGSGVAESKGGIAVVLGALQALRYARVLKNVRCGILLTTDDSIGGRFSKSIIHDSARNSKRVIGTKYGSMNGGIVTSCSGVQYYQIEILNIKKERKYPNIAEIVSRKNLALLKLASPSQGIYISINSITVQTNPGQRSDRAEIGLSVSFETMAQGEALDLRIKRIVNKGSNGSQQVHIKSGECRLPIPQLEINQAFFEVVEELADMLEVRIEPVHRDFSADICHVPQDVPVLGGFGPVGGDSRTPNEFIVRDSLLERATLMAMVIYHSAKQGKATGKSKKILW